MKAYKIIICGIFAGLIAMGAFIKIPIPIIPVTMQIFFTSLAGLLLGAKLGSISVLVYIVLGLFGIPIFTKGGGIWYILEPTFGYLIGFIFGTYVTGFISHKFKNPSLKILNLACVAGILIVYFFGVVHLYVIRNFYLDVHTNIWNLLNIGFASTIFGDLISCFVASIIAKRIYPFTNRKITYE